MQVQTCALKGNLQLTLDCVDRVAGNASDHACGRPCKHWHCHRLHPHSVLGGQVFRGNLTLGQSLPILLDQLIHDYYGGE